MSSHTQRTHRHLHATLIGAAACLALLAVLGLSMTTGTAEAAAGPRLDLQGTTAPAQSRPVRVAGAAVMSSTPTTGTVMMGQAGSQAQQMQMLQRKMGQMMQMMAHTMQPMTGTQTLAPGQMGPRLQMMGMMMQMMGQMMQMQMMNAPMNPEMAQPGMGAMNGGMAGMGAGPGRATQQYAPLVGGIYEGDDIFFIHTEASDPDVAAMLTTMMQGPLVVAIPELANTPPELLAQLYVFANGVEGQGPFGFQKDIFDSAPGDPAYRPLRNLVRVQWNDGTMPRVLNSVADVEAAEAAGEISLTQTGVVVNMPVLIWPGGSR